MQLLDARRFAVRRFKSNHVYFPLIAFHKAFTKANHPLNIIASQNMSRFPKDPRKQPTSSFVFRTSASKTTVRDRSNTDPRTRRQNTSSNRIQNTAQSNQKASTKASKSDRTKKETKSSTSSPNSTEWKTVGLMTSVSVIVLCTVASIYLFVEDLVHAAHWICYSVLVPYLMEIGILSSPLTAWDSMLDTFGAYHETTLLERMYHALMNSCVAQITFGSVGAIFMVLIIVISLRLRLRK
eukprot:169402_1